MKTLLIAAALLVALPGISVAQTTATGTGNANSNSQSGAVSISGGGQGGSSSAQAGGGSAAITFNTPGSTQSNSNNNSRVRQSGSLRTTPNAIAPGLGSAAIETCYGPGVSAGLAVTGFGASFGAGQYDNECNLRLWARTLYAMGQRELVGAVLAQSPTITKAMGIVDQQRVPGGQVVYGAPARAAYGGPVVSGGCQKWSGGSKGAGVCVY